MTSLCTSQWRRRYVSNETPNNVSVERCQDISVVHLHGVLLVCGDDVSWGRNDDLPSIRLHDISDKSQMKHPIMSQWYVTKTSQWYVFTTPYCYVVMASHRDVVATSHQYASTMPQTSLKWNTQWRLSGMSLRPLSGSHHVPLVRLYDVFCNSQMKHPITSLWYVSTTSWSRVVARRCL